MALLPEFGGIFVEVPRGLSFCRSAGILKLGGNLGGISYGLLCRFKIFDVLSAFFIPLIECRGQLIGLRNERTQLFLGAGKIKVRLPARRFELVANLGDGCFESI